MHRQRVRMPVLPKPEWKTLAISATNALEFAKQLQSSLQELTNDGYIIISQMNRGDALIITAQRLVQRAVEPAPDTLPELPTGGAPTLRRRIVDLPSARAQGQSREEVLYHFQQNGEQQQRIFPSLIDALRVLNQHLQTDEILPLNITTLSTTRFELDAFPMLLKMFAEDLPAPQD